MITDLVIPQSVASDDATDFIQMVEVRNAVLSEQEGPDAVISPEELLPRIGGSAFGERLWALAKADGRVVARAQCLIPFDADAPEASLGVEVLAKYRRRGIGTALLEWAGRAIRDHGKTIAQARIYMFARADGPTISPASGYGAIPLEESSSGFALHHGAILAQVDRVSVLDLPASEDVIAPLYDDALARAADTYSLVTWTGMTPDEWLEDIALLRTRMTTDVPAGELTVTQDVWDTERVRVADQGWLDSGWEIFIAACAHRGTGQLVAFTQIVTLREETQSVNQMDTLVLAEHRGHRLGTLMKIANIRALQSKRPLCPKIVTGNADENVPMLRVNEALGFRAESLGATWRLDL